MPRFLCPLFLLFLFFFAPQGTRQCLAHGCHLTLRGAADVGASLLGGGEDVDGDGIADGASATGGTDWSRRAHSDWFRVKSEKKKKQLLVARLALAVGG